MMLLKNVSIEATSAKDGDKTDGSKWYRHAYKIGEGWYSKFVTANTPLMEKGTVLKELHFEEGKFGYDIKQIIIKSMPKPGEVGTKAELKKIPATSPKDIPTIKDHPFWFILAYTKDLQVERMAHITEAGGHPHSLDEIMNEVVNTAEKAYRKLTKAFSEGGNPKSNLGPGQMPIQEPVQEPKEGFKTQQEAEAHQLEHHGKIDEPLVEPQMQRGSINDDFDDEIPF